MVSNYGLGVGVGLAVGWEWGGSGVGVGVGEVRRREGGWLFKLCRRNGCGNWSADFEPRTLENAFFKCLSFKIFLGNYIANTIE